jgi:hypothetical protein
MNKKDFYPINFSFFGLGFLVPQESGEIGQLYASFFYAHHGGFIEEINADIIKRGLRPMTRKELGYFFGSQKLSLEQLDYVNILATAPEDIKRDCQEKDRSLMPGIWKEDGNLKRGDVIVSRLTNDMEHINDHFWTI